MTYRPLQDYGIIGDMRTAALVSSDGSIDWLCVPHFDSPSVFGRLLDDKKGGYLKIAPATDSMTSRQMYWPETNALVTRFLTGDGAAELIDFMPVGESSRPCREVVRKVRGERGEIRMRLECQPAFDYGRAPARVRRFEGGVEFVSAAEGVDGDVNLFLASDIPLQECEGSNGEGGAVQADFTLHEGQSVTFILRQVLPDDDLSRKCATAEDAERAFRDTVQYWHDWISRCKYSGRWREMVYRSALVLKLLTFEPSGAIIAAPTCSLPEQLGGSRNWDYRYVWIRDSAFAVYALLRLGLTHDASAFMRFLAEHCAGGRPDGAPLHVMYGIDGRQDLDEEILGHLDGYRSSRPVRIGNAAHDQLQLDIFGELLDAAYLFNKWGEPISADMWQSLRRYVDWVCENWQQKDEGIWEVRGGRRHFVYSKLMCWVAVDRGLRLAEKRSLPADRGRWLRVRDEIYKEILDKGWSEKRRAFVQSYGSESLDAATLMMPLTFFMSPTDPKMLATIDAMMESPARGGLLANSLVFRYNPDDAPDGLQGREGTFNICTFWLVEALTRAGRFDRARLDEARLLFERMLGFANHLGLYAEETSHQGEALGNFPLAFTHLGLISAAFNLDRALGEGA